ncbi:MAG: class I SAM-dependent methyltransferase [Anaerolineae bacterium]|nr:class I SAM-dependent methyltransferase [Anaerolineae bacterium]
MTQFPQEFLDEVHEAWTAPFSGWDFSWLEGKYEEAVIPWDYMAMAREKMKGVQSVLDMDTGGGERFSTLAPFPPYTCATETYEPNIPIARARLEPLGVQVFAPVDDAHQPFADDSFDLVLNRHGSYDVNELRRILKPGGRLLTQQVGGQNEMGLNELLQDEVFFEYAYWTLDYAVNQLKQAGFKIVQARDSLAEARFYTIGAVVYYLRIVAWQVEGFDPSHFMQRLYLMQQIIERDGWLQTNEHRFLIEAQK